MGHTNIFQTVKAFTNVDDDDEEGKPEPEAIKPTGDSETDTFDAHLLERAEGQLLVRRLLQEEKTSHCCEFFLPILARRNETRCFQRGFKIF